MDAFHGFLLVWRFTGTRILIRADILLTLMKNNVNQVLNGYLPF